MPFFSIIIPAYNAAKTLEACVGSIVAQTYTDWECIIVNDGSKDSTASLCDRLAAQDARIRVHHTTNQGVASARNAGLQLARGEWLVFVDADDRLAPDGLSLLVSGTAADMVITGHQEVSAERMSAMPLVSADVTLDREAFAPFLSDHLHLLPMVTVWAKALRREVVERHGLRFDGRLRLGEDCAFIFAYLQHVDSCRVLSATPYLYTLSDKPFGYPMDGQVTLYHLSALSASYHELCQRWHFESRRYNTFHAHSFVSSYCSYLHVHSCWWSEPYQNIRDILTCPFVVKGLFDGSGSKILSARMALAVTHRVSRWARLLRPYLYVLSLFYTK